MANVRKRRMGVSFKVAVLSIWPGSLKIFGEDTVCDQNDWNFDTKDDNEYSFRKYRSYNFAPNHL